MDLTDAQIERYSRQIILPAIGGRGQQRLLDTTVSVVGAGSLASTVALYLTAAGIGHLDLLAATSSDADDLQTAQSDLAALNPDTTLQIGMLDCDARAPFSRAAVVVCADVAGAVLAAVNRAALSQRIPLIVGATGSPATIALYAGHHAEWPCAECDPRRPACTTRVPTADPTSGFIGSVLALEAIKSCLEPPLTSPPPSGGDREGVRAGWALHYDPETLTISESPIGKRATCRACALDG